MSDLKYMGVPVPMWYMDSPDEFGHWRSGVEAALKVVDPISVAEPEYRYYHDGDIEGDRWFYRALSGSSETVPEVFKEYHPSDGWMKTTYTRDTSELAPADLSDLPSAAKLSGQS